MRKIAKFLVFLMVFLQTGCWNAREINELAFVLSIGIDKTNDGFKVTAQMAKPATYSKTPSGGGSTDKEKSFWIISSTGKTIFEAIRNMSSISSRRIFWSHIKVIILSEQLAKSNTLEIFDFFSRNAELRLRTLVAVTPGEAGKLFEYVPEMESDPSIYLEKIIENKNLSGKSYSIMLKDFLEDYLDPNVGPVTSRIVIDRSQAKPVLKTSGAYVFKDHSLVGSLNEEKTRGLLWIKNKMHDSVMVVSCPYDGMPITLEIKNSKSNFETYIDNGVPHIIIKVSTSVALTEQGCLTDFNQTQELDSLKQALESAIQKDIQSTLSSVDDLGVDFTGFSRKLHRQHKNEWHKLSSNWPKNFNESQARIIVKVAVPHMSLAKPLTEMNIKSEPKN
jgi:spore germination protein KC